MLPSRCFPSTPICLPLSCHHSCPCPRPLPLPPQVIDEVFDRVAARKMGIDQVGQVCIMIHSGSRGLGHQVRRGGAWPCRAAAGQQGAVAEQLGGSGQGGRATGMAMRLPSIGTVRYSLHAVCLLPLHAAHLPVPLFPPLRWPLMRWCRWRRRWRATASSPTTASWPAHASTRRWGGVRGRVGTGGAASGNGVHAGLKCHASSLQLATAMQRAQPADVALPLPLLHPSRRARTT